MSLPLRRLAPYGYALAGVVVITAVIGLVRSRYAVPDLTMVYLVLVLWLGARHGIFPAALAGVAAVLAYDFFFVPPPGTLAVRGPNELLGLVLLLAAALVTGQLAASLRQAAARSSATAEEATALYDLATAALRMPEVNSAIGLLCDRARAMSAVERFSLLAIEDGGARVAGGDDRARAAPSHEGRNGHPAPLHDPAPAPPGGASRGGGERLAAAAERVAQLLVELLLLLVEPAGNGDPDV
ncbi:MAG TPA: DUF4118 domain-containing protein [Candidatus Dormibacteraeota bacterium]|jgi:two-component system sensor histidine kinase KdpD